MKKYKANKKGFVRYFLASFLILPFIIIYFNLDKFAEKPLAIFIILLPFIFLMWLYFDTYYIIDNKTLKYKSAFIKGEINILNIKEIVVGKTLWVGTKPALAENGLIIKYNSYDTIYIAPENNDVLIADLCQINNDIQISRQI